MKGLYVVTCFTCLHNPAPLPRADHCSEFLEPWALRPREPQEGSLGVGMGVGGDLQNIFMLFHVSEKREIVLITHQYHRRVIEAQRTLSEVRK